MSLLVVLAVVYGVLSIVDQLPAPKSILPAVGSIYAHWSIVTLTFVFLANLIFATIRIPVRWDRAGAWCCHLGMMFLAVGSVAFWQTRTEGQCYFPRMSDGSWSKIDRFFLSNDVMACYVSGTERIYPDSSTKTVLEAPTGMDPYDIDIPIKGAPDGVTIRATKVYPRADIEDKWFDDGVVGSRAVELEISRGNQSIKTTMCESYPVTCGTQMPGLVVVFKTMEAMSQAEVDDINKTIPPTSQPSRRDGIATICYTGKGPPSLMIRSPSGKVQLHEFAPGQSVSTTQGELPYRIRLLRALNHARFGFAMEVPPKTEYDRKKGAIELEIKSGSYEVKRTIPYSPNLAYPPMAIRLPTGRTFYVAFSGSDKKLPEPIKITRHEFKTAPGSSMAEDYVCDLEIGSGVHTRKETLKLNFPVSVGEYRLTQGSWLAKDPEMPDYSDPGAIILGTADRPGILLIFVGSIALCVGLPYAFYVKPLILKRKSRRAAS